MGKNRFELAKIGRAAAEKYFKPEHLPDDNSRKISL